MTKPLHVAILALAILTAGCASARPAAKSAAGPGDIVRLLPREAGSAPNEHPADYTSAQLHQMLSQVKASGAGDVGDESATPAAALFQGKDLDTLARNLSAALSRATSDQDVGLRVSQLRADDRLELLKASRVTSARAFRKDGKLHLIFGRIDDDPRAGIRSQTDASPRTAIAHLRDPAFLLPEEIGSRLQPNSRDIQISASDGVAFPQAGRVEWIALSLPSQDLMPSQIPGGSAATARGAANPTGAASTEQGMAATELEARLMELRKLHNAGLITDEVYRATMQRLLDSYL